MDAFLETYKLQRNIQSEQINIKQRNWIGNQTPPPKMRPGPDYFPEEVYQMLKEEIMSTLLKML